MNGNTPATNNSGILKTTLAFFAIAAVAALILAGLNELTHAHIEENKTAELSSAMERVIEADSYEEQDVGENAENGILKVFTAKKDGKECGFCVLASCDGYKSEVKALVGIDAELRVTGVEVSCEETPGLGAQIAESEFLENFKGKSGTLTAVKGEPKEEKQIAAVSGATVSSRAVTEAVNRALSVASQLVLQADKGVAAK